MSVPEEQRSGEPVIDQPSRIFGRETEVPGQTRQDRIRFGQCVAAEGDLAASPPCGDLGVSNVGFYKQGDRDARIKPNPGQRRPLSISPNTASSSIVVSPTATSTPFSSITRATLPAGLT